MSKRIEDTIRTMLMTEEDTSGLPKEVTDWWQKEYVQKYKSNKFNREYALQTLSSLYDMVRNKQDTRVRKFGSRSGAEVQTDTFQNKARPEYAQKFLEYLTKTQGSETPVQGVGMGVRPGFPGENSKGWLGTGAAGTDSGAGTTEKNYGTVGADRGIAGAKLGTGGANQTLQDLEDRKGDQQVGATKGSTNVGSFAPKAQVLPGVPSGANQTLQDIKDKQSDQQIKATTTTTPSTADIIAKAKEAARASEVAQFKMWDAASVRKAEKLKNTVPEIDTEPLKTTPVKQTDLPPLPNADLAGKLANWVQTRQQNNLNVLTSPNGKEEVPSSIDVQVIDSKEFEKQYGELPEIPEPPKPTDISTFKPRDSAEPPKPTDTKAFAPRASAEPPPSPKPQGPPSLGNTQSGINADWEELKKSKAAAASGAAGKSGAGDVSGGNQGKPSRENPDNWENWFNALTPSPFYLTKDMEKMPYPPQTIIDKSNKTALGYDTVGNNTELDIFPLYQKQLKAYLDNPNPNKKSTDWVNPYGNPIGSFGDGPGPNKIIDYSNVISSKEAAKRPNPYYVYESVRSRAIRKLNEQANMFSNPVFDQPASSQTQAGLTAWLKKNNPQKVTYSDIDPTSEIGKKMVTDLDAISASNARGVRPIGSMAPSIIAATRAAREAQKPEAVKAAERASAQKMDMYVPYDDAIKAQDEILARHNSLVNDLNNTISDYNSGNLSYKDYRIKGDPNRREIGDLRSYYNSYVRQQNNAAYMSQYKNGEIDLKTAIDKTGNEISAPWGIEEK